jgi:hypothetical protein
MIILVALCVPLALLLLWAVAFDVRQRRRHPEATGHDAVKVARRTRIQAEGKGSEYGL